MEIRFIKVDPTQNMTILVATPVAREFHADISAQLMDYAHVHAEQVGFIEPAALDGARIRLQMMGGEFCGNAAMSCAAYLAYSDKCIDDVMVNIPLEVSGSSSLVTCSVIPHGFTYTCTVSMPLPESIRTVSFSNGIECPVVFFPGIAHAILPEADADDLSLIEEMCSELGVEAFGLIRTDFDRDRIRPLVYVPASGTKVYERGCGSGTAALIAWKAHSKAADVRSDISQPGGIITAEAIRNGDRITSIRITGKVRIRAVGTAFVEI